MNLRTSLRTQGKNKVEKIKLDTHYRGFNIQIIGTPERLKGRGQWEGEKGRRGRGEMLYIKKRSRIRMAMASSTQHWELQKKWKDTCTVLKENGFHCRILYLYKLN